MSSRIIAEIDYEKDGKQVGWLGLPHSVTRSAYGKIMIPIAVIRNGKGPTVFFQAGNHGDEYEGQIALVKLIRELDPAAIQGRVIVLPAANFPAAMAGTRVSPIDEGNLNRAFPGSPDGTVTQQIAYYIDSVLFPQADLFHDLHSGGSSLRIRAVRQHARGRGRDAQRQVHRGVGGLRLRHRADLAGAEARRALRAQRGDEARRAGTGRRVRRRRPRRSARRWPRSSAACAASWCTWA